MLLYISQITLPIGIFPIVLLKNSSSIVLWDTDRKEGNNKRSFPNLPGCSGCVVAIYLLRVNWVWSWIACTSFLFVNDLPSTDEEGDDEDDDEGVVDDTALLCSKAEDEKKIN